MSTMSLSPDEGEIEEDTVGNVKTSHQTLRTEIDVDRQARKRGASPFSDSSSRRSDSSHPSRSPRSYKRSRTSRDRYPRGRDYDSWRSRARHDDHVRDDYFKSDRDRDADSFADSFYDDPPRHGLRRSRVSYHDLNRPPSRDSFRQSPREPERYGRDAERPRRRNRYDDRPNAYFRDGSRTVNDDRGIDRRNSNPRRRRSRSSGSSRMENEKDTGFKKQGKHHESEKTSNERSRQDGRSFNRGMAVEEVTSKLQNETLLDNASNEASTATEPELDFRTAGPIDEDAEIERRRKRREELLVKSKSATPSLPQEAPKHAQKDGRPEDAKEGEKIPSPPPQNSPRHNTQETTLESNSSQNAQPESPGSPSWRGTLSPARCESLNGEGLMNLHGNGGDQQDGPSAADYDPTFDMQEDERRDERRHGQAVVHGEPHPVDQATSSERPAVADQVEGTDTQGADDDFDMFAEDFDEAQYAAQQQKRHQEAIDQRQGGILEDDDAEGFYKVRVGEVLNESFKISAVLGQGMFARVVRAVNLRSNAVVAIKMMRNNYAIRKGGYTEIAILRKLNEADEAGKKYIVRFEESFEHRGHLCMVFEGLEMNLREVLRKFGKNVGINLGATRAFARQIFIALDHMRRHNIIHADLKPDNILINESRQYVKICDLGTAIDRSNAATAHAQITPYLISRFYRAPEVILGMDYDYGIDMWSIGCTLFELFTGKILFPGESNNQMLKVIMQTRGRMHPKYYKKGELWQLHFTDKDSFISTERDKVTHKEMKRFMTVQLGRSVGSRLEDAGVGMSRDERQELDLFKDLLENCLTLHSERRFMPSQALRHAFFQRKAPADTR